MRAARRWLTFTHEHGLVAGHVRRVGEFEKRLAAVGDLPLAQDKATSKPRARRVLDREHDAAITSAPSGSNCQPISTSPSPSGSGLSSTLPARIPKDRSTAAHSPNRGSAAKPAHRSTDATASSRYFIGLGTRPSHF